MFKLTHNAFNTAALLKGLADNDVPFAVAIALTKTAKEVQAAEVNTMKRVFDRPTPFALSGTFVSPATLKRPEARVLLKDNFFGDAKKLGSGRVGVPAVKFLAPQIFGGTRQHKKHEKLLIRAGLMPPDMYAVPGGRAKLDRYGNISGPMLVTLLSAIKALEGTAGFAANRSQRSAERDAKRKRPRQIPYFVGRPGNGNGPLGIWQRVGNGARPIVIFVRAPQYKPRFPFYEEADRVVATRFVPQLRDAVQSQLARAQLRRYRVAA